MKKNVTFGRKTAAAAVFGFAAVSLCAPAMAQGPQVLAAPENAGDLPKYYENLCVAEIDLGNDGDDWMDALAACRDLAKRLKQLEHNAKVKKSTAS